MAAIFSYKSYDLKFIILRHGPSYPPSLIAFVLVGLELNMFNFVARIMKTRGQSIFACEYNVIQCMCV